MIHRSSHICIYGEGQRSFAKAFEERFLVRDMKMLADHNNFMSFDIDNELDAIVRLYSFARYVLQPLNSVLQEKLDRLINNQNQEEAKTTVRHSRNSSNSSGTKEGSHNSAYGSRSSSFAMSTL